jgi:diguanylate cyclase (GGDEF)-like protein
MDLNEKFASLQSSLMKLARADGFLNQEPLPRLRAILHQCAEQLAVDRVSVWVLNEENDQIKCKLLYIRQDNSFESGAILLKSDYPKYFKAITKERIINAAHAQKNPITSEFTDNYLEPLGIMSMLDAPIFNGGKLYGVLCIEHTDQIRIWDIAEMSYGSSVADTISLDNEHEAWIETNKKLDFSYRTDSLTTLENRHYFQQRLDNDWQKNKKSSRIRALIIIGLDKFSELNDAKGAKVADKVLICLSERFQKMSQSHYCLLSRLGGDLFGFWVQDIKEEKQLEHLVKQIFHHINEPIKLSRSITIEIQGSMGVLTYPQSNLEITSSPLRCAEIALKKAKQIARGSVAHFSSDWMDQIIQQRIQESELLKAFDGNQLKAYYQPIVLAESKEIVGIEALVRWQHPTRGLLTPFQFLPLLAELGLMSRLGRFMMRQACSDILDLKKSGLPIKWVSVNLSPDQIYDKGLIAEIDNLLCEFNLPKNMLELEIIEELIGQDSDFVRSQLLAISNLGVRLSIDDFGTGYSSLSRLKHLPVSKLKIDKSFVDGLPESVDDQCIAKSIIGLALGMNLKIVAEGVENKHQADWLIKEGSDYLQGYLYSKPLPIESLLAAT